MNQKITALIPTYRRPEYLRRAILSALRQTYDNLQVSVFDNSSLDETEEVVRILGSDDIRLKYHRHEHNIGGLANFRFAFQSVNTPFFSILSDDDLIAKDFYENAISILNENPKAMFVILNTLTIDENADLIIDAPNTDKLTLYFDRNRFDAFHLGEIPITWTGMVFRREVAEIFVRIEDDYDITSDMRFLLHSIARYKFAHLSKTGAFFTAHSRSFSSGRNNLDYSHYAVQIFRYFEILNDHKVDEYIRNRARFYLKNMLLNSNKQYFRELIASLKRIVKNSCDGNEYSCKIIERDIKCFQQENYTKTAFILKYLYANKLAKRVFNLLFYRYKVRLLHRYRSKMYLLQYGIYRELFEDVKQISTALIKAG